ncbi:MAG: phage head morphogenesis protein, partial [Burkholderiaceae bacterium]
MPVEPPPGLRLGMGKPEDAVNAFQARNLLQPSFRWQDVFNEEHSRAFAVAGVSRLDVLQAFQDELELTLTEGRSLADFGKRIRPQLNAKGFWGPVEVTDPATGETRVTTFDDARLRTIFDVNMRQSNAAGRWARIERTKKTLPLVMYRTMQDERVRASHRAWDGVVLPVDAPFWNTHYPPNGWRCRCRAFALDQADVDRRRAAGQVIKTEAPPDELVTYVNPRTGEVVPVPRGIDPGFGYNPGKARDAELYEQLLRKSLKSSPLAGATAVAQATLDHGAMVAQATQAFGAWVDQVLGAGAPRGAGLLYTS